MAAYLLLATPLPLEIPVIPSLQDLRFVDYQQTLALNRRQSIPQAYSAATRHPVSSVAVIYTEQ